MNSESFIVYGWEEYSLTSIIDINWLRENNISIFALEIKRNIPCRIVYGILCGLNSNPYIYIKKKHKNNVSNAFNKLNNNNNLKLQYYIAQETNFNYYSFYRQYNPEQPLADSDTEDNITTDVSNNEINYEESNSD